MILRIATLLTYTVLATQGVNTRSLQRLYRKNLDTLTARVEPLEDSECCTARVKRLATAEVRRLQALNRMRRESERKPVAATLLALDSAERIIYAASATNTPHMHAEQAVLRLARRNLRGGAARKILVITARITDRSVSRPCAMCRASIESFARATRTRAYMIYTLAGIIVVERAGSTAET